MSESPAHAPAPGGVSRARQYLIIFFVLFLLTVIEVAVAYVQGHKTEVVVALFALAVVKAACVALFFMHLKNASEKLLKLVVASTIFFLILLLALSMFDYATRSFS